MSSPETAAAAASLLAVRPRATQRTPSAKPVDTVSTAVSSLLGKIHSGEIKSRRLAVKKVTEALVQAVRENNRSDVTACIQSDYYQEAADSLDEDNMSALHYAARSNYVGMIEILLESRASAGQQSGDHNMGISGDEGLYPLHLAAKLGNLASVERLLKTRVGGERGVNQTDNFMQTPLHLSVDLDDTAIASALMKHGADVNLGDIDKVTPLHVAASRGRIDSIKLLLEKRAKQDVEDQMGATPLFCAAREGYAEALKVLIDAAKAEGHSMLTRVLHAYDRDCNTPLHTAAVNGNADCTAILVKSGASIMARNKGGATPLHLAAIDGNTALASELLKAAKEGTVPANQPDGARVRPLHMAAQYGHPKLAALLIEHGAKIDGADDEGLSALMSACSFNQIECVELLLKKGASQLLADGKGKTALFWAIEDGHAEVVAILLAGKDGQDSLSAKDRFDNTPLHKAAAVGLPDIIKLITAIDQGKELLNVQNSDDSTPLHLAAKMGHPRACEALLANSYDMLTEEDNDYNTPLHLAAKNGHAITVQTLLRYGAPVDSRNENRWTPLDCAAENGHVDVIDILLDAGAPIGAKDKAAQTPLHLACRNGHVEAVKFLIRCNADLQARTYVENTTRLGLNPLDMAVNNGHKAVCAAIVADERWKEALVYAEGTRPDELTPFKRMVTRLPETAALVLDRCIYPDPKMEANLASDHPDYAYRIDFSLLDENLGEAVNSNYYYEDNIETGDEKDGSDDMRHGNCGSSKSNSYWGFRGTMALEKATDNSPLTLMLRPSDDERARTNLLAHPLVEALLQKKFRQFGLFTFLLNFLFYSAYIFFLTFFIVDNRNNPDPSQSSIFYGQYVVVGFSGFRIFTEILQIFQLRLQYLRDPVNLLEWATFTLSLLFVFPVTDSGEKSRYQWECGAYAVFLAWCQLLFFVRRFAVWGIYVLMFIETMKKVLIVLAIFILFVIGFSLSFFIIFQNNYHFATFGRAFLKTFIMMTGEFEYSQYLPGDQVLLFDVLPYFIFFFFVLVMPIVLMNLLIGLAVDDIQRIMNDAKVERRKMRVLELLPLQEFLSWIHVNFPHTLSLLLPGSSSTLFYSDGETVHPYRRGWYKTIVKRLLGDYTQQIIEKGAVSSEEQLMRENKALRHDAERLHLRVEELQQSIGQQTSIILALAKSQRIRTALG